MFALGSYTCLLCSLACVRGGFLVGCARAWLVSWLPACVVLLVCWFACCVLLFVSSVPRDTPDTSVAHLNQPNIQPIKSISESTNQPTINQLNQPTNSLQPTLINKPTPPSTNLLHQPTSSINQTNSIDHHINQLTQSTITSTVEPGEHRQPRGPLLQNGRRRDGPGAGVRHPHAPQQAHQPGVFLGPLQETSRVSQSRLNQYTAELMEPACPLAADSILAMTSCENNNNGNIINNNNNVLYDLAQLVQHGY